MIEIITNILMASALFPVGYFIYRYLRYSAWNATNEGKIILIQNIAFLGFLVFVVASIFVPDFPFRDWVRLFIYLYIGGTFWAMLVALLSIQKQFPMAKKSKTKKVRK